MQHDYALDGVLLTSNRADVTVQNLIAVQDCTLRTPAESGEIEVGEVVFDSGARMGAPLIPSSST